MKRTFSRRQVIRTGILAAITAPVASDVFASPLEKSMGDAIADDDGWRGFKVGAASYTFRKLSLDDTLKAMNRAGLKYMSIKDFHLPLTNSADERRAAVAKIKSAGITPLSCGNITMQNDEDNIRKAFEYARDCQLPTIVCSPDPDSFAILDKMVKEFDIKLAIHNHGPEDKRFPSPYDIMKAIERYDHRIGLCIDVGHTARAKVNPAEAIVKCRERLYDMHFKDITSTEPDADTVAAGRGALDLSAMLSALIKIKYNHLVAFEYESTPDDPLPEVMESVGYTRGLLNGLTRKK